MLKPFMKLLAAAAVPLLLNSCAGDVMQIMKTEKQSVGVLVIRPASAKPASARLEAAGPTYTHVKEEVDSGAAATFGTYDNGAKTLRKYGQTVVSRLRAQGIDAHLLDSYPPHESLIKGTPMFARISSYPAETKKYPRCLVLHEATLLNLGPSRFNATTLVSTRLFDTGTSAVLGGGTAYDHLSPSPLISRAQAHAALDESSRKARQNLLDEVFYDAGE